MATDRFVDAGLRTWQLGVDRATKLFGRLSDEAWEKEVAPGKNRLIYLYGHLLAVSDAMIAQLRLGERLHPELDDLFLKAADRTVELPAVGELKTWWEDVHGVLKERMEALSPEEWAERHAVVSEEDFAKEPHRNRFTMLLGRTGHLGYHLGQAVLAK
jgi:hypothetical protein